VRFTHLEERQILRGSSIFFALPLSEELPSISRLPTLGPFFFAMDNIPLQGTCALTYSLSILQITPLQQRVHQAWWPISLPASSPWAGGESGVFFTPLGWGVSFTGFFSLFRCLRGFSGGASLARLPFILYLSCVFWRCYVKSSARNGHCDSRPSSKCAHSPQPHPKSPLKGSRAIELKKQRHSPRKQLSWHDMGSSLSPSCCLRCIWMIL